jgi:hypothetical protein
VTYTLQANAYKLHAVADYIPLHAKQGVIVEKKVCNYFYAIAGKCM